MKRIVEEQETGNQPLENYLGEHIQVWCMNYIYAGRLVEVYEKTIILEDAGVVYETGCLDAKEFKDNQRLPHAFWAVERAAIESWGLAPQLVSP